MEVTAEQLLRAEQYWEEQKARVKKLAERLGREFEPSDEFLFDLFDCGEKVLTDKEVMGELEEHFRTEV